MEEPMNEWELMKVAGDVDEGDTIDIANSEDHSLERAILIGAKNRHTIRAVDLNGRERLFDVNTLSERGNKTNYIAGKSRKQLRMSEIKYGKN